MAETFNLQQFIARTEGVAALMPASDIFGLLTRSFDLPARWAALVTKTTGDHALIGPGAVIPADNADEVLFVRTSPIELRLEENGLTTQDHFQCRVDVTLRLSLLIERSELISFQKAVLGSYRVATTANLQRYLAPSIRAALAKAVAAHEAKTLIDADGGDALVSAVLEALDAPCFTAGLRVDGVPTVSVDSTTFRQVREEEERIASKHRKHQAARELQRALESAQDQHLDHLATMLAQLRELAEASPDVDLNDLMRTFSQQQRGELYEALFASPPEEVGTAWIAVAAGDEIVFFDPKRTDEPARRVPVLGSAGPVRSIQTITDPDGRHVLLLGAATGVYRLPIDASAPDVTLCVDGSPSVRGGFNAATLVAGRVFASHSELGIYEWDLAEPDKPRQRFASMTREARAVRGVTFAGGGLYCSIGDRVIRWHADSPDDTPARIYAGADSTISALIPTTDGLIAGTAEGDVLRWSGTDDDQPERLHGGSRRAVESLWLLGTHGVDRLIYADTSLYVHAQVLGDSFTCRYEAGGQTLRRVEIAPDLIVATNDVRDRLICWSPGTPDKPSATIPVARLCRRSVQDVCLIPRA